MTDKEDEQLTSDEIRKDAKEIHSVVERSLVDFNRTSLQYYLIIATDLPSNARLIQYYVSEPLKALVPAYNPVPLSN